MEKVDKYYKKMTESPVEALVLKLGVPTTVSMLITNIYNLADTYFVGTLGETPQGATGILFTLQAIIQAVAFMLGHGSGTYVAKALAQKDTDTATKYVSTGFFVGGFLGIFLLVIGLSFLTPLIKFLGSTDTILPYAKDYGFWVLVSCPFMICSLILNNNLRYEGIAFFAMIGLCTGGLLNILGDYIFITKLTLGVYGAGLSTAISQVVSFFILLGLYITKAQAKLNFKKITLTKTVVLDILKGGLPSLLRQGLASFSNGLLNNFTKQFGDCAIAGISIVNRYTSFVLAIGLGVGQGFQPVASFNYSAQKYKRVKKGLVFTWGFSSGIVILISLMGIIFAPFIIQLFQKEPETVKIGVLALRYASIGLIFLPTSTSANMLFQSIRRSKIASFLATLRSGLVIPVLIILYYLLQLNGIIMAQAVADVFAGIISIPFIINFLKNDHKDSLE